MNKIKIFLLAAILVIGAGSANAQGQKSGYISVEQMVGLMPELAKIDTVLQKFQNDSLNTEFAALIQDYQYRDSMLTKTDTTNMPPTVRREHRQQREADAYQIQNWQQISQNYMQGKQQELLAPVYQRVMDAIRTVAKDNGYGFVYNQEALLVAPPGDNLLPLVAKRLNVKLPAQGQGAQPQGGARPAGAANRPRQ
jgi:outer membrane protein